MSRHKNFWNFKLNVGIFFTQGLLLASYSNKVLAKDVANESFNLDSLDLTFKSNIADISTQTPGIFQLDTWQAKLLKYSESTAPETILVLEPTFTVSSNPESLVLGKKEELVPESSVLNFSPNLIEKKSAPKFYLAQIPNSIPSRQPGQSIPNPIPSRQPEQPIPIPQPAPDIPIEITPPTTFPREERPEIPGTVTVTQFEFEGNTAFSDEELSEAVQEFTKKPITFTQLLQIEEVISNKYTEGCRQPDSELPCYINSGAFIVADQTFAQEGAVVKVQVVEGELEEIEITGTRGLNSSYVRSRLERAATKPLELGELLKQVQLLQLDPLIKNISAELAAGSTSSQSRLEVNVTESDPFFVELFTDNGRDPSVGSWRRGLRINEGNLFGFGDSIFLEYTNTDGSNAVDLGYSAPLNASNTTITVAGGLTDTEVVEPPFDRIDIQGDSFNFELGLRQPIFRTPTQELALGITGTRQESNTEIDGQNFAISPGADENGETRISALRLFQEYTRRNLQEVFAVRSQFSVGLDAFDATVNEDPLPDSRFFAWRGQGQYVRRLARDTLLVLRSDLQFSTTSLVPLEQFSLGGLRSVRGYRQDSLLTDNGFFTHIQQPHT